MGVNWVKKWEIEGSNGNIWIVAIDENGNYGCSCPIWKFKRKECHHILQVKNSNLQQKLDTEIKKPNYVLAKVFKPKYKVETNELLIPLVAIPDSMNMEVTICFYMLKYGYSISEIREIRHLPNNWTKQAITEHIEKYGEVEYPNTWYDTPFCRC